MKCKQCDSGGAQRADGLCDLCRTRNTMGCDHYEIIKEDFKSCPAVKSKKPVKGARCTDCVYFKEKVK